MELRQCSALEHSAKARLQNTMADNTSSTQDGTGYQIDEPSTSSNALINDGSNSDSNNQTDTIHPTTSETNVPLLHQYAQQGDLEKVRSLLDDETSGVKATDVDGEGITALHWAAMNSALDVCRLLLERGADVDAVGGELHATPLHWATR